MACGCGLGWEPEAILTTTISQIELAIEGRWDFVKKTNPFGSGEENEELKYWEQGGGISDAEVAMQQIVGLVKNRQGEANRKEKPSVSGGRRRRNN